MSEVAAVYRDEPVTLSGDPPLRRIATFTLDGDALLDWMRATATKRVTFSGIPDDARCVGMSQAPGLNRVVLYLESEQFPEYDAHAPTQELVAVVRMEAL